MTSPTLIGLSELPIPRDGIVLLSEFDRCARKTLEGYGEIVAYRSWIEDGRFVAEADVRLKCASQLVVSYRV